MVRCERPLPSIVHGADAGRHHATVAAQEPMVTRTYTQGIGEDEREGIMSDNWLMPKGSDLIAAVRWLSEQQRHDRHAIEEASLRFDLSPLDEEFLLQHCREQNARLPSSATEK